MQRSPRRRISSLVLAVVLGVASIALASCSCGDVQEHWRTTDEKTLRKEGQLGRSSAGANGCLQQGNWRYYHKNGVLRAEGDYRDDRQEGDWVYYFDNGSEEMVGSFSGHRRHGEWNYYYESGRPRATGRFDQGKRIDPWTFWEEGGASEQVYGETPGQHEIPIQAQPELSPSEMKHLEMWEEVWRTVGREWNLKRERVLERLGQFAGGAGDYEAARLAGDWGSRSASETLVGKPLPRNTFHAADGSTVDVGDFKGRPVVIVILRGYAGRVCEYCVAQIRAFHDAKAFAELEKRRVKLLVVYPGPPGSLEAFRRTYKSVYSGSEPSFTWAYDVDLKVCKDLDIVDELAKPTTLVVDSTGVVRWAYIGSSNFDRPAVAQIIREIDAVRESSSLFWW